MIDKKLVFRLSFLLALFFGIFFYGRYKSSKNTRYLEEINLSLKGVVNQKISSKQGHDVGILDLKIISSSINSYDERRKRKVSFGVIKYKKGKILVNFLSQIKENDTIIIKGTKYKILRKDKVIREGLWDLPFDLFFSPYPELYRKMNI